MPPSPFFGFSIGADDGVGLIPKDPLPPPIIPDDALSVGPSEMLPRAMSSAKSLTAPIPPPPMPFARLSLLISLTLRFISSCASRSLDCLIIVASFSSWLSISMFTWMSRIETGSLWPRAMISSKAKTSSNTFLHTLASSTSPGQYSLSTLVNKRSVSKSSTMFDCLLVMMTR